MAFWLSNLFQCAWSRAEQSKLRSRNSKIAKSQSKIADDDDAVAKPRKRRCDRPVSGCEWDRGRETAGLGPSFIFFSHFTLALSRSGQSKSPTTQTHTPNGERVGRSPEREGYTVSERDGKTRRAWEGDSGDRQTDRCEAVLAFSVKTITNIVIQLQIRQIRGY